MIDVWLRYRQPLFGTAVCIGKSGAELSEEIGPSLIAWFGEAANACACAGGALLMLPAANWLLSQRNANSSSV